GRVRADGALRLDLHVVEADRGADERVARRGRDVVREAGRDGLRVDLVRRADEDRAGAAQREAVGDRRVVLDLDPVEGDRRGDADAAAGVAGLRRGLAVRARGLAVGR